MKFKTVKISEIDRQDHRFRFNLKPVDERILTGVKEAGVVQPLLVILREGRLILVDGWRRLEAALSCHMEELPVFELESRMGDLGAFQLAFFINYTQHRFSLAEKALAARRFLEFNLPAEEIIERILPLLELPPLKKTLEILLEISSLDGKSIEMIHRKDWKQATAELWLRFLPEERNWMLRLIERLTHNQQHELVETFYSVKKLTGVGPEIIVREKGLDRITGSLRKGESAAFDRLLAELRKITSPLRSRLSEEISEKIKELKLPLKVQVDYDPTLEKPGLKISFEARSAGQLEEIIKSLSENFSLNNWDSIFQLLNYRGD
ncbi:MAG: ParB N-terminal domain-containing protein [Candidatus Saccharicenans sp.]|nr:ParB N-terminal domain-containing protein [Candidatus Saccharicenans sp.]